MDSFFDPEPFASLPWSPIALWQANLQMMNNMQQAWLKLCLPWSGMPDKGGKGMTGSAWPILESLPWGTLFPMPRVEATITPVKREGSLAGVEDASRLTMRITVPGLGGRGAPEILLVDALVARAAGENALRLENADLSAALPKKAQ